MTEEESIFDWSAEGKNNGNLRWISERVWKLLD